MLQGVGGARVVALFSLFLSIADALHCIPILCIASGEHLNVDCRTFLYIWHSTPCVSHF